MSFMSRFKCLALVLMLVGSIAGIAPAHAQTPNWRDAAIAAASEMQSANAELVNAMNAYRNSPVYSDVQDVMNFARSYDWRTTYSFQMVNKDPLSGQVKALVADPPMSMLDAVNYLNTTMGLAIPYTFCEPAPNLGFAGKAVGTFGLQGVVQFNHYRPQDLAQFGPTAKPVPTAVMINSDWLNAFMARANGNKEFQALTALDSLKVIRKNACTVIYTLAQLNFRAKRIQEAKDNWDDCTKNGVEVWSWQHNKRHSFGKDPYSYTRTIGVRAGINYKCGSVANGSIDDALEYNSYFKWSTEDEQKLNIIKRIRDSKDDNQTTLGECPTPEAKMCIPLVKGKEADVDMCMQVQGGLTNVTDTVPLSMALKFHFNRDDARLCIGPVPVPAPFGLAQSLGEQIDSAKQNMKSKAESAVKGLIGGHVVDLSSKLSKLMTAVSKSQAFGSMVVSSQNAASSMYNTIPSIDNKPRNY